MAGIEAMAEITEINDKLKSENDFLTAENKRLEEQVSRLQCNLANTVHQLMVAERGDSDKMQSVEKALHECKHRLEGAKTELKHVKKALFEKNRRFQEDCITINRLQVTIETLVERMAQKTGR